MPKAAKRNKVQLARILKSPQPCRHLKKLKAHFPPCLYHQGSPSRTYDASPPQAPRPSTKATNHPYPKTVTTRPTLLLAILLTLAIFTLAALPTATKHALHIQGSLHPYLHLFAFTLLAYLLLRSTNALPLKLTFAAALILFGYATEAYESHKDGWPIEQKDVQTDTAGVLLGSALSLLPRRKPAA